MNILLTSVGRRRYLVEYLKEVLTKEDKIICCNASNLSTALKAGDNFYISPMIYESNYIDFLLDICKKEKISVLISLFDIDLPILAKNREKFEDLGVKLIISDFDIIDICNDKYKMYKFLKENNFDTIYTSLDIKEESINEIFSKNKKVILKPRWGMGSLSIYKADDYEQVKVFYKKIIKEIQETYLKYEAKNDINSSVLIQEIIEGKEYGLDIMNDLSGNYLTTVVKEKLAMRSGETDIAKIVDFKLLQDFGKKVAKITRHIGNMDLDLILNEEGIYIIDMNARFGGGYPFTHMAGVNFLKILIDLLNNKKISKKNLIPKYNEIYAKDINIINLRDENF